VSAKDGKLLWRVEIEGYRVAVIPTPIYKSHVVYVSCGYNAGCHAIRLAKNGDNFSTDIHNTNKNMCNHHGGVVSMNGNIYGFSDASGWTCQNMKTGDNIWTVGRTGEVTHVGKGAVLAVNDRLLCLDEKTGLLAVIAALPDGWKEFGRIEMPERTDIETKDNMVWAHPVVANGKLFVRDQDLLFCYDLRK
jgi:outer membrane protein assembly factor BamB